MRRWTGREALQREALQREGVPELKLAWVHCALRPHALDMPSASSDAATHALNDAAADQADGPADHLREQRHHELAQSSHQSP